MAKHKNPKKKWIILGIILLVVILVGVLLKFVVIDKIEDKAATQVVEKLLDSEIASDSTLVNNMSAQDLYDSMSEEDQNTLKGIITDNLTPTTMSKASKYLANKDMTGLKKYAKEILSDEELAEVKTLYKKYAY